MAKAKARDRDRDRFLKVVLNLKKVRGSARAELFFLDFFLFVNLVINIPSVINILHECGAIEVSKTRNQSITFNKDEESI